MVKINPGLTDSQTGILERLMKRHRALFNDFPGIAHEHPDEWLRILVDLKDELALKTPPLFRNSPKDRIEIDRVFDMNRTTGRMGEIPIGRGSPYALQVFVARRNGKPWPVVDMRPLNALVPADSYPIPRQDEVLDAIGGHLYITSLDVTSSFYQRMIHVPDQYRTTVASHRGHEYFRVAVMGYKRSVQHNQRLFNKMFKSLLWRTVCVYIDDIFIYSNSFEEHVRDLDKVMQILSDKGFTLKAKKAFIAYQSIEVLGRQVDCLGLSSTVEKMEAIQKIEFPRNLKDLESFIGLASWNRHLIPFLAH